MPPDIGKKNFVKILNASLKAECGLPRAHRFRGDLDPLKGSSLPTSQDSCTITARSLWPGLGDRTATLKERHKTRPDPSPLPLQKKSFDFWGNRVYCASDTNETPLCLGQGNRKKKPTPDSRAGIHVELRTIAGTGRNVEKTTHHRDIATELMPKTKF